MEVKELKRCYTLSEILGKPLTGDAKHIFKLLNTYSSKLNDLEDMFIGLELMYNISSKEAKELITWYIFEVLQLYKD